MKENVNVPIDISASQYQKLKGNLELFNADVDAPDRLTFDELVSLAFETATLEEKLDSKYDYLNILNAEIKALEDELAARYSMGLEADGETIECRRQILRDCMNCIEGPY